MTDLLFIGIGVARPAGMQPLPGVLNSVAAMDRWACDQGYTSVTITDEQHPVTAPRLCHEILAALREQLERIVVYFAGHGFLTPPDQIWILSDGPDVNSGRVSRDTLRGSLATYRPKQISVIADSCQVARYFQTGTVPILLDRPGPRRRVFVDGIYSAMPNEPAFAFGSVLGANPFCLFTSVLADFLMGTDERAFKLANGTLPDVTTQTLYFSLPDAVLERGAVLGVDQEPRIEPGFPFGQDVYSRFAGRTGSGAVPPDVPLIESIRPPSTPPPSGPQQSPPELDEEIVKQQITAMAEYGSPAAVVCKTGRTAGWGVIVNEQPTGFAVGPNRAETGAVWYPVMRSDLDEAIPYVGRRSRSLMTLAWANEVTSGFCMIPTFEHLVAIVQLADAEADSPPGCSHLSWVPDYDLWGYRDYTLKAWEALKHLLDGTFGSMDVRRMADDLRVAKHANPIIGVVCAYLYDAVGDSDSISRLCHFYVAHSQPIPFDIALLSNGHLDRKEGVDGWLLRYEAASRDPARERIGAPSYLWRATEGGTGEVGGMTPLIRAGWSRLRASTNAILRGFGDLEPTLSGAPVATIVGDEGRNIAAKLLKELEFFRT
jgi:hypothetical protein